MIVHSKYSSLPAHSTRSRVPDGRASQSGAASALGARAVAGSPAPIKTFFGSGGFFTLSARAFVRSSSLSAFHASASGSSSSNSGYSSAASASVSSPRASSSSSAARISFVILPLLPLSWTALPYCLPVRLLATPFLLAPGAAAASCCPMFSSSSSSSREAPVIFFGVSD